MKRFLIFTGLLFLGITLFSQNHDFIWLFGRDHQSDPYYAGSVLDFHEEPPLAYHEFRDVKFNITNTSMCDSLGNLLFYTNGRVVYNVSHDTMPNGADLNPGEFADFIGNDGYRLDQGVLALPMPESEHLYYLFHLDRRLSTPDMPGHSKILYYTLIDMELNAGSGAVVEKNQVIVDDFLEPGKLTAVKHNNGRDWWMLVRKFASNEYYRILITPETVSIDGITATEHTIPSPGVGQAVFSPDGNKFANLHIEGLIGTPDYINIYDVDRCTGELSNQIAISYIDSAWAGGLAISPNSRFLYVSSFLYLYQYDLWADNIEASKDTVAIWDGFTIPPVFATTFYLAQLAPDGKIYINSNNAVNFLHVINQPDLPGDSCDVCQHCVGLASLNFFSLPNFPNYRLGAAAEPCDSIVDVIESVTVADQLYVYPNPASGFLKFQLEIPATEYLQLEFFSARGQKIQTVQIAKGDKLKVVEVRNWPGGIYFYRLSDRQGRLLNSGKVVIR